MGVNPRNKNLTSILDTPILDTTKLAAVWTSNVSSTTGYSSAAGTTVTISNTSGAPNQAHYFSSGSNIVPSNPHQYGTALPSHQWTQQPTIYGGGIQVATPDQPLDGYIANINGKVYRYSAALNEWHEVIDAPPADVQSAEKLPIVLDATDMLIALTAYRDFLNDLDGLDQETGNAVDDALFGLDESIRALEKLGQK